MSGIFKGINEKFPEKSSGHPSWQEPKDEFLSAFFECSGQGLVIMDIDLTIVRFNMMGEMLMESVFGINLNNIFNLNLITRNRNTAILEKLLVKARQNVSKSEFFTLSPDTNPNRYIVHVRPIFNNEGTHLGTGIGIRNITETKRIEKEWADKVTSLHQRSIWQAQQLRKLNDLRKQQLNLKEDIQKTEEIISSIIDFSSMAELKPVIIPFSKLIPGLITEFQPSLSIEQNILHKKRFKSDRPRTELLLKSLLQWAVDILGNNGKPVSLNINVDKNFARIDFSFELPAGSSITVEKLQLESVYAGLLNNNLFIACECIRDLDGSFSIKINEDNLLNFQAHIPNC